jgi:hypothetical protein
VKLTTYMGKRILELGGSSEDTSSKISSGREGKSFAWSRGIGVEISPIKTRSCRKNFLILQKRH